jgi:hypothetical protein
MLVGLAQVLGVRAFQLLAPADTTSTGDDSFVISGLLRSLKKNIQDDINSRFDRLLPE